MAALDALPLNWRKHALGRLLANAALRRPQAWSQAPAPVREDVQRRLEGATDSALGYPVSPGLDRAAAKRDLDEWLAALPDQVVPLDAVPADARKFAEPLLAELRGAIDAFLAGSEDPLEQTWGRAKEAAERFYELCGFGPPAPVGLRVGFRSAGKPHRLPRDVAVGGRTEFRPARRRLVHVILTRELGWEEQLTLPYVLFHELVAHAFAGEVQAAGVGRQYMFAEGWMDFVAKEVHDAAVLGSAPLAGFELPFPKAVSLGKSLHLARYEDPRPGPTDPPDGAFDIRETGRRAAELAEEILDRSLPGREPSAFWRLSAALNRSDRSLADLDDFCAKLKFALEPAWRQEEQFEAAFLLLVECATALEAAGSEAELTAVAEQLVEDTRGLLAE